MFPQTKILSNLLVTPYCPDIVIFNTKYPSNYLLKLTCPLDSPQHIQAVRNRNQRKVEYFQLLAKFNCLKIRNYYETIEISVLGHYQPSTVKNLLAFVNPELKSSRSVIKNWLLLLPVSLHFLAKYCKECCQIRFCYLFL